MSDEANSRILQQSQQSTIQILKYRTLFIGILEFLYSKILPQSPIYANPIAIQLFRSTHENVSDSLPPFTTLSFNIPKFDTHFSTIIVCSKLAYAFSLLMRSNSPNQINKDANRVLRNYHSSRFWISQQITKVHWWFLSQFSYTKALKADSSGASVMHTKPYQNNFS